MKNKLIICLIVMNVVTIGAVIYLTKQVSQLYIQQMFAVTAMQHLNDRIDTVKREAEHLAHPDTIYKRTMDRLLGQGEFAEVRQ
ncbi:MAG: hypothetical protein N2491_01790 [Negativicutes bacterium]|nr:hypothetical protein [Negativicutes bacterium]